MLILARDKRWKSANKFLHGITVTASNALPNIWLLLVFIPNRTFLVGFGGISGEFGRAMVRILGRRRLAKIPMARPNEPDMPPKRSKKVRLGIYRTQIRIKVTLTPLFQSDCLSTCRRSWQASSSLVLAGKIFAPSLDRKTPAKY